MYIFLCLFEFFVCFIQSISKHIGFRNVFDRFQEKIRNLPKHMAVHVFSYSCIFIFKIFSPHSKVHWPNSVSDPLPLRESRSLLWWSEGRYFGGRTWWLRCCSSDALWTRQSTCRRPIKPTRPPWTQPTFPGPGLRRLIGTAEARRGPDRPHSRDSSRKSRFTLWLVWHLFGGWNCELHTHRFKLRVAYVGHAIPSRCSWSFSRAGDPGRSPRISCGVKRT